MAIPYSAQIRTSANNETSILGTISDEADEILLIDETILAGLTGEFAVSIDKTLLQFMMFLSDTTCELTITGSGEVITLLADQPYVWYIGYHPELTGDITSFDVTAGTEDVYIQARVAYNNA